MTSADMASQMIFGYFLVVARLGTALMFLPGFGEQYYPSKVKLMVIMTVCFALYPVTPFEPPIPDGLPAVVRFLILEVTIGLWIGLMARILFTSLQFAGYQVGIVSALANAFAANSGGYQGSTIIATFLLVTATALIFITNTHHVMIQALIYSYDVFPVGQFIAGDHAQQTLNVVHASMYIGMAMAAPFYMLGILNNVSLGLANRMMPTLPVFFVASALLVGSGILVFSKAAPSMLDFFLTRFSSWFMTFKI